MTVEFNWILGASIAFGAVLAWLHTVFTGKYTVKAIDTERYINLPFMGTIAALAAALAAFLTGAYTLIPAVAGFFGLLSLFAATDYYYRRLPNVLTGYTALYSLVTLPVSLMYFTEHWVLSCLIGLAAGVTVLIVFGIVSLFTTHMGMGDVKLAPSLAFWVVSLSVAYLTPVISPENPADAGAMWLTAGVALIAWLFLSFATSLIWLVLRLLVKSIKRNHETDPGVPFGVFLALSTVIAVIAIPVLGMAFAPTIVEEIGIIF